MNIVVAAVTVLGASWLLHKRFRRPKHRKDAPGPPGLPVLGHATILNDPHLHRTLAKWANQYGGIYKLNLGGPAYVVTDAELVATLLQRGVGYAPKAQHAYDLSKDLTFPATSIFNECNDDSPAWKVVRKTMAPCFSTDAIKKAFLPARECAEQLAGLWSEAMKQGSAAQGSEEGVVDISGWMNRCTLDVLGRAGFHTDFKALEEGAHNPFLEALHELLQEFSLRLGSPLRGPLHKLLPWLPAARRAKTSMEVANKRYEEVLDEMISRGEPSPEDWSISAGLRRVMAWKDPATGQPFSRTRMLANIAVFVVAGFDTGSATAMWALYDIARHPDIQQQIHKELSASGLLHTATDSKPGRPLEWGDLQTASPTFNAALKESMRLHTAAALGTIRVAPQDMDVGGFWVPKGAVLWVPLMGVHTSAVNFTNPAQFDISRWMGAGQLDQEHHQEQQQQQQQQEQQSLHKEENMEENKQDQQQDQAQQQQHQHQHQQSLHHKESNQDQQQDQDHDQTQQQSLHKKDKHDQQAHSQLGKHADIMASSSSSRFPHATPHGHASALEKSVIPFSDGPRNCIGMSFAYMSVRTILLTLLSRFQLEVHPDTGSAEQVEEEQVMALVVTSGRPIKLVFRPHQEQHCRLQRHTRFYRAGLISGPHRVEWIVEWIVEWGRANFSAKLGKRLSGIAYIHAFKLSVVEAGHKPRNQLGSQAE